MEGYMMWTVICVYCKKPIEEKEPCYPVYDEGNHKQYRHIHCHKPEKPFGEVLDDEIDA